MFWRPTAREATREKGLIGFRGQVFVDGKSVPKPGSGPCGNEPLERIGLASRPAKMPNFVPGHPKKGVNPARSLTGSLQLPDPQIGSLGFRAAPPQ